MKATEVIKELQNLIDKHGDLVVYRMDYQEFEVAEITYGTIDGFFSPKEERGKPIFFII